MRRRTERVSSFRHRCEGEVSTISGARVRIGFFRTIREGSRVFEPCVRIDVGVHRFQTSIGRLENQPVRLGAQAVAVIIPDPGRHAGRLLDQLERVVYVQLPARQDLQQLWPSDGASVRGTRRPRLGRCRCPRVVILAEVA